MAKGVKHSQSALQLTRTMVWIIILGYGLFLVGRSTYENYRMNKEIAFQRTYIRELEKTKSIQTLALIYFKSNSFREVEARRRLGVKGKDEKVVALPKATTEPTLVISQSSFIPTGSVSSTPPLTMWWNLFFGKSES